MKNAIIWNEHTIKEELINHFGNEFGEDIADSYKYNNMLGNRGSFTKDGEEYTFIESVDIAEGIAIDHVKGDLEVSPELFVQSWLKDFIHISDTEKRIMCNEEKNSIREMVSEYTNLDDYKNEEEYNNAIDEAVNIRLEEYATSLENPIEYFVNETGMFTIEDFMKQNWISIDIGEAAKDAIKTDGWAHFLSKYDGKYETTQNGIVYFRE